MTPAPSTKQHAGQRGITAYIILVERLMLLCSRVLVAQCHLAAASNHKAITTLPAVSLTHKATTSSLVSGNSNPRSSKDYRARKRARTTKDLKNSASSVAVPATKPWSVN